jgi:outer membrane biosynthesis protein TonB
MRWSHIIGAAFFLTLPLTLNAQGPAPKSVKTAEGEWYSSVSVIQRGSTYGTDEWYNWIRADDMPPETRNRSIDTQTTLQLDVTSEGRISSCMILSKSVEPTLDAITCELVLKRGSIKPKQSRPGQGLAEQVIVAVRWWTIADKQYRQMAFAPPPAPPRFAYDVKFEGWPRLKWGGGVKIESFVNLQDYFRRAAVKGKTGVTSIDLIFRDGSLLPDCTVGKSSGHKVLDAAACDAVQSLGFAYSEPCRRCGTRYLPLQFLWNKKQSYIQVPLDEVYQNRWPKLARDPNDPRAVPVFKPQRSTPTVPINSTDFDFYDPYMITNTRPKFAINVDQTGKPIGCQTSISTGDVKTDEKFCKKIVGKLRYPPATDIFGNPVAVTHTQYFRLRRLDL